MNCTYILMTLFRYTYWTVWYKSFNSYKHVTFSDASNRLWKYSKWCIFLTTNLFSKFEIISNTKQCAINYDQCCTIICSNCKSFKVSIRAVYPCYIRNGSRKPSVVNSSSLSIMLYFDTSEGPSLIPSKSDSFILNPIYFSSLESSATPSILLSIRRGVSLSYVQTLNPSKFPSYLSSLMTS